MDPFVSKPFYQQPNPVEAYFVAMQKFLGAPATGTWDPATHVAFYRWLGSLESNVNTATPWGSDPDGVAYYITETFTDAETAEGFAPMQRWFVNLNLPATSAAEFRQWLGDLSQQAAALIEDTLERAAAVAKSAEQGGASNATPETETDGKPPPDVTPNGTPPPSPPAETDGKPPPNGTTPNGNGTTSNGNGNGVTITPVPPSTGLSRNWKIGLWVGGIALGLIVIGGTVYYYSRRQPPTDGLGDLEDCGCG